MLIAGVDEAGRGPLAGPVAVAAVILSDDYDWSEIDDSKRLTHPRREQLADIIKRHALAWKIELVPVARIDSMNILQATLWGMVQVVGGLCLRPDKVLVDGNRTPDFGIPAEALIGGDGSEKCIGAASILAKTARDRYMTELDDQYPGYGFALHKGYPTPQHLQALKAVGACAEHRTSFAPVRAQIQGDLFA